MADEQGTPAAAPVAEAPKAEAAKPAAKSELADAPTQLIISQRQLVNVIQDGYKLATHKEVFSDL